MIREILSFSRKCYIMYFFHMYTFSHACKMLGRSFFTTYSWRTMSKCSHFYYFPKSAVSVTAEVQSRFMETVFFEKWMYVCWLACLLTGMFAAVMFACLHKGVSVRTLLSMLEHTCCWMYIYSSLQADVILLCCVAWSLCLRPAEKCVKCK